MPIVLKDQQYVNGYEKAKKVKCNYRKTTNAHVRKYIKNIMCTPNKAIIKLMFPKLIRMILYFPKLYQSFEIQNINYITLKLYL